MNQNLLQQKQENKSKTKQTKKEKTYFNLTKTYFFN
jgi:hypothetical protein